jgi:hypothetical protein
LYTDHAITVGGKIAGSEMTFHVVLPATGAVRDLMGLSFEWQMAIQFLGGLTEAGCKWWTDETLEPSSPGS